MIFVSSGLVPASLAHASASPALTESSAASVDSSPVLNSSSLVPSGQLILAAEDSGSWNLFAADARGGPWQPIAGTAAPARDPAVSPDGKTLAFRSRRDGFWDIYTMPASGGTATRLTRGMIYSGAPVWSPDGKRIAFESYARGDLDVWVMNADGTQAVDLTDDSKFQEYGPAWSPDGRWIAFASWQTGLQQIFVVPADCTPPCKSYNISQDRFDNEEPAWSPDGNKLAFVSDRDGQRAIYTGDFSVLGLKNVKRLTFSGWDEHPAWSPDGSWIAFVSARPTRQPVYLVPASGGVPRILEDSAIYAASVAWAPAQIVETAAGDDDPGSRSTPPFQSYPDLAAPGSGHPYELRRMTSTRLDPGINKLNGRVADSFVALQTRIKQEVGYDFLSTLADMSRPLDLKCDVTCDTLSWHKAGRAFDSRLDYADSRGSALEVVREDQQGETFWRMFLRTAAQDGSMGEPVKEAPWDLSYRARWIVGRGEGGIKKPVPYGFYIDVTELAREYGWERISSHDDAEFDWRTDKTAAEYWHYQQLQGLNWYQAMREVYSATELASLVEWNSLISKSGFDPYVLDLKGIPAPPKAWQWNVLGP